MNRMTAIAIFAALTAWPGLFAHAQPASSQDAKPYPSQRAAEPTIRCTHQEGSVRALQPCGVRPADEALRLGSNVTRQEYECVLSGVCGADNRSRVNG